MHIRDIYHIRRDQTFNILSLYAQLICNIRKNSPHLQEIFR